MPVTPPFSPQPSPAPRNIAVRTGVYVGAGLSVVLVVWIFLANRLPYFDKFALQRNLAAAALLVLVGLVPVVRFLRAPAKLWISSLIGWTIFSVSYALMSLVFSRLGEHFGAFQIFVLGAVVYMIIATIAWLGTIVWRTWSEDSAHRHHPVS
jgi:multisubunit Na+/H+ antiporter MnhB subunit